jgi:hypothetical protein
MQHSIGLLPALLVALPLSAQEFTQKAAHEHGRVSVNVAVDGEDVAVDLESPALHVVGFERAPRDEAERRAAADAVAWLRAGRRIAGVPAGAGCRLVSASAEAPQGGEDHDHDHEHEHDDEKSGEEEHADYRGSWRFRCANPEALAWIELWALDRLQGVESVRVNIIAPAGSRSVEVAGTERRIALR